MADRQSTSGVVDQSSPPVKVYFSQDKQELFFNYRLAFHTRVAVAILSSILLPERSILRKL